MPSTTAAAPLWWRIVRRILAWVIVLVVAWWSVAYFIQRRVLFAREYTQPNLAQKDRTKGLEEISIDTPDGKVEAWFIPGVGVSAERPGPAVIFAHGNAELIDDQPGNMVAYRAMGISVLLVEFRGYGRSAGSPSRSAIDADFLKARSLLEKMPVVDASRIIYHGRSLGGAAVTSLADEKPPAVLILESPFRSVASMMYGFGVPSFIVRDNFDSEAIFPRLNCPILLMHGTRDTIVPHRHSVALKAAAKDATLISFDCDHNNFPPNPDEYWGHIEAFLRKNGVLK